LVWILQNGEYHPETNSKPNRYAFTHSAINTCGGDDPKSSDSAMSSKNGEVKKPRRQRAVIIITENEDDPEKFNASLEFNPSIKDKRTGQVTAKAQDHIVCRTAWHVWHELKSRQKNFIVLTDE
jgi:hypothetical protein